MNDYRTTIRFRLEDERHKRAADFLKDLDRSKFKSVNQVIVDAVNLYIDNLEGKNGNEALLEQIRLIVQDEMRNATFVSTPTEKVNIEIEQAENDQAVLDFLEDFV